MFVLRRPLVVALSKVFFCRTRIRENRFEFLTTPETAKDDAVPNARRKCPEIINDCNLNSEILFTSSQIRWVRRS